MCSRLDKWTAGELMRQTNSADLLPSFDVLVAEMMMIEIASKVNLMFFTQFPLGFPCGGN